MSSAPRIRAVLRDIAPSAVQTAYAHEHFIIDSPFIEVAFPHIHLFDVDAALSELGECREAGLSLALDAMPCSSGRRIDRLAEISERSGVDIVAATGLHHNRYYGDDHWTNRVGVDALVQLFVEDLTQGIDLYDYTGPIVARTAWRAGVVKVATSGESPDERDLRNLEAAAHASLITGAPILTHCEGGLGAVAQIEALARWDVTPSAIMVSHIDKSRDYGYLRAIASAGAFLEFDQSLRDAAEGVNGFSIQSIASLVEEGYGNQIVVGTDGARRSLWRALGGEPGLAWLARELPSLLRHAGVDVADVRKIMGTNAADALTWREGAA